MHCSQMDANRGFISSECLIPSGENGHVDARRRANSINVHRNVYGMNSNMKVFMKLCMYTYLYKCIEHHLNKMSIIYLFISIKYIP